MLGWTVLNQLKRDPATRHIPVQILTIEEERQYGLERGAFSFINKPLTTDGLEAGLRPHQAPSPNRACGSCWWSRTMPAEQLSIRELHRARRYRDLHGRYRRRGAGAAARAQSFDCVVLDLRLPDMSGFELLDRMQQDCAAAATSRSWCSPAATVRRESRTSCAQGQEHRAQGRAIAGAAAGRDGAVPAPRGRRSARGQAEDDRDAASERRRAAQSQVLVVDDDIRNIFALNSLLERHNMQVISANNGQDAIRLIESTAGPVAGADGHHDARDGRLRDHAPHPQRRRRSVSCRSSR